MKHMIAFLMHQREAMTTPWPKRLPKAAEAVRQRFYHCIGLNIGVDAVVTQRPNSATRCIFSID
jgi:hypothetical protein